MSASDPKEPYSYPHIFARNKKQDENKIRRLQLLVDRLATEKVRMLPTQLLPVYLILIRRIWKSLM